MTMRLIGLVLVLMALCIVTTAQAGNANVARKQIESSLLVTGTITVAPDGSVLTHTLDSTDDLGDVLTKFVNGSIDKWRFEPVVVDGQVVTAKVPMSLRLTAKPAEDGNMSVAISNTHFGKRTDSAVSDDVRGHRLAPPIYPAAALSSGGKGTVYMIVQIGRDGLVIHADAEQVNLRVVGNQREMDMMRELLAAASVRAAKQWTFNPPTTGKSATENSWLVRVPVDFILDGRGAAGAKRGGWDSYVPGPRNANMPWAREELKTAGSPDALSEGGVYSLQEGAKLLFAPTT
jgi:hypothetical protein